MSEPAGSPGTSVDELQKQAFGFCIDFHAGRLDSEKALRCQSDFLLARFLLSFAV